MDFRNIRNFLLHQLFYSPVCTFFYYLLKYKECEYYYKKIDDLFVIIQHKFVGILIESKIHSLQSIRIKFKTYLQKFVNRIFNTNK